MIINPYRYAVAGPPSAASAIYAALVAWWPMFDNDATLPLIRDNHSTHHMALRYLGAATNTSARTNASGVVGRAMNLLGSNDSSTILARTDTACDGNTDADYSFGGWFKTSQPASTAVTIIGRSAFSAGTPTMWIGIDATAKLYVGLGLNPSGTQTLTSTVGPNATTWQFMVATYNKTANKLELRYRVAGGSFQYFSATLTGIVNAASSVANFVVGEHAESGINQASVTRNGVEACDECFFANKAITDAEFDYLYNAAAGRSYAQLVSDATGGVIAPIVENRAVSAGVNASSHPITLPGGIVAGNLLLVFFACKASSTIASYDAGWTKILEAATGALTTDVRFAVFAKLALGSDALTVAVSASTFGAHATLRMAGNIGSLLNVTAAIATGTLDPPSVTPAHGADYYAAIAALGWIDALALTSFPTGYIGGVNSGTPGAAGRTAAALADKGLPFNATTEDPDAFVGAMTTLCAAATVLVNSGAQVSPVISDRVAVVPSSSAAYACTMPAGIVAGNLILQFVAITGNFTISSFTAGWTKLQESAVGSAATDVRLAVFAKIAAGGDALTVTLSGSSFCTNAGFRMSGVISSLSNVFSAIANSIDPPAVTPAHGADYYTAVTAFAWIATAGSGLPLTGIPNGYPWVTSTNPTGPSLNRPGIGFTDKALPAGTTTENPGTFAGPVSAGVSATLMIYSG